MLRSGRLFRSRAAFTLIELLVVVAIIGLLISILVPALSGARRLAKSTVCRTRLRTLGHGMILYANANKDTLVPGRLPNIDDDHWRLRVPGGVKYRPSFQTMMAAQVGLPPFDDPKASKNEVDVHGQPGDRQNYSNEQYLCPEVSDWVDERNGAYGYNYQFLGNSRLLNEGFLNSYKNWPVKSSMIRTASRVVAIADCIGTAASFATRDRGPYEDNAFRDSGSGRSIHATGNEGFNLDPPWVDPSNGEMAELEDGVRSAIHERHGRTGNVLWMDGHASPETLDRLGYKVAENGAVELDGDNRLFHIRNRDEPWVRPGIEPPRRE
jgi:prepilin-type N-terminal cleavage/methylation domain-containing protein/prepilin-type processing-associated H-X9-DG protein